MEQTFVIHYLYTNYEGSSHGNPQHKVKKGNLGHINNRGYMQMSINHNGKNISYFVSRFIWECHNGPIPPGMFIDHINRNPLDNRLENLRLVTPRENNLNSAPKIKLQQCRPVIGVHDGKTLEESEKYFPSMYSAGKYYDIQSRSVQHVADGIYNSAYSKKLNCWVSFVYQ